MTRTAPWSGSGGCRRPDRHLRAARAAGRDAHVGRARWSTTRPPRRDAPGRRTRSPDGRVHRGHDVDWYPLTVPAGQNTVTFALGGTPFVRAGLTMTDSTGAPVAVERSATYDPTVDSLYRDRHRRRDLRRGGSSSSPSRSPSRTTRAPAWATTSRSSPKRCVPSPPDVVPGDEAMQITPFEQDPAAQGLERRAVRHRERRGQRREQQRLELCRERRCSRP